MGGPFIPRTSDQLEHIPAYADAMVALGSSVVAATAVAPFVTCVDRAVVSYTAHPDRGLFSSIWSAAKELATHPRTALKSPAVWMVSAVYGLTYAAANLSDLYSERHSNVDHHSAAAGKFVTTTAANMGSAVLKDAAFARMFGGGGPAATVPMASYLLFAGRDCFTIGGAFFVPEVLADTIAEKEHIPQDQAMVASQLVTPVLMQGVCTPLHVLALQLVNSPTATASQHLRALFRAGPSVLVARSLRMLPAYGIGGILNGSLEAHGRDWAAYHYCPHLESPVQQKDYKLLPMSFLYGPGVHPVMLAREWALLVGGKDIVRFIEENDEDGDGKLDVVEVEHLLERRGLHEGARELVAFADKDGDGEVSAEELKAVLLRRYSTSHSRRKRAQQ